MSVRLRRGAREDIAEGHAHYLREAGRDVATRFRGEVGIALLRIREFPLTWPEPVRRA